LINNNQILESSKNFSSVSRLAYVFPKLLLIKKVRNSWEILTNSYICTQFVNVIVILDIFLVSLEEGASFLKLFLSFFPKNF